MAESQYIIITPEITKEQIATYTHIRITPETTQEQLNWIATYGVNLESQVHEISNKEEFERDWVRYTGEDEGSDIEE